MLETLPVGLPDDGVSGSDDGIKPVVGPCWVGVVEVGGEHLFRHPQ